MGHRKVKVTMQKSAQLGGYPEFCASDDPDIALTYQGVCCRPCVLYVTTFSWSVLLVGSPPSLSGGAVDTASGWTANKSIKS